MRIDSVTIRGFGCLCAGRRYEFPRDKATLIVDENERGKSTLAAALVAGLCGFPQRKASGETLKPSDVYKPWTGEPCGLEMEIEAGGTRLVVERDFGRGSFVVRDASTGRDVSAEFKPDLAEHFLRLPRDDFRRVAFISGKEVSRFSSSPKLRGRLSAVAEGSTADAGAEVALALLEDAKYPLDGSSIKPETAVKRLQASIDEKLRRMNELDAQLEAASEQVRLLEGLQAKRNELEQRCEKLDVEYAWARLAEMRERIAAAQADIEERERLIKELKQLEPYAGFPAERRAQLEGSIIRRREIVGQIEEKLKEQQSLQSEADRVRVYIDGLKQFSLATNDDLIGLAASADALEETEKAVDAAQQAKTAAPGRTAGAVGWVLAGTSVLCGIASMVSLALQSGAAAWSIVGLIIAALVGAAGAYVLIRTAAALGAADKALEQAVEAFKQAAEKASRRLSALGVQTDENSDLKETLSRTREALENYLRERDRLNELNRQLISIQRGIADLRERAAEEKRIVESILRDAGIDESLPPDEALIRFEEAAKKHARYRQIADFELPRVTKRIPPDDELQTLASEERKLAEQVADSSPPTTPRRSLEVESERQSVRSELEDTLNRIKDLESRIGLTVAQYRRDYPVLEEEVRNLRMQSAKAARYKAAVERAAQVLKEVAESSRRRWAAALNERASAILPSLNPDYDNLRFDDSLDFTIRHIPDGRIIEKDQIDAQLSTGAKDQIYLAVRLACCEELSAGGEPIPIILDDALVSFDDERFESAMRHVAETLSPRHQVIILTCHRNRHERLAEKDWFRERVAVVDL